MYLVMMLLKFQVYAFVKKLIRFQENYSLESNTNNLTDLPASFSSSHNIICCEMFSVKFNSVLGQKNIQVDSQPASQSVFLF